MYGRGDGETSEPESDEPESVEEDNIWPAPLTFQEIMDEASVELALLKRELEALMGATDFGSDAGKRRVAVVTLDIAAYEAKLREFRDEAGADVCVRA